RCQLELLELWQANREHERLLPAPRRRLLLALHIAWLLGLATLDEGSSPGDTEDLLLEPFARGRANRTTQPRRPARRPRDDTRSDSHLSSTHAYQPSGAHCIPRKGSRAVRSAFERAAPMADRPGCPGAGPSRQL